MAFGTIQPMPKDKVLRQSQVVALLKVGNHLPGLKGFQLPLFYIISISHVSIILNQLFTQMDEQLILEDVGFQSIQAKSSRLQNTP